MAWSLDPSSPRRDHTIKCTTPSNRSLYSSPVRTYLTILRIPAVRSALVLGLIVRIPMWAASIILTLHVVGHLGRSYGQAGIVIAAATIAVAISGPWRGRLLDQRGLRRSTWPNLIVLTLCWLTAPWVMFSSRAASVKLRCFAATSKVASAPRDGRYRRWMGFTRTP